MSDFLSSSCSFLCVNEKSEQEEADVGKSFVQTNNNIIITKNISDNTNNNNNNITDRSCLVFPSRSYLSCVFDIFLDEENSDEIVNGSNFQKSSWWALVALQTAATSEEDEDEIEDKQEVEEEVIATENETSGVKRRASFHRLFREFHLFGVPPSSSIPNFATTLLPSQNIRHHHHRQQSLSLLIRQQKSSQAYFPSNEKVSKRLQNARDCAAIFEQVMKSLNPKNDDVKCQPKLLSDSHHHLPLNERKRSSLVAPNRRFGYGATKKR